MSFDRWITTTEVLEGLRRPEDMLAWERFCTHFRPVIVKFAIQLGLSSTDAEDAAQETMLSFLKAFREGKYAREKGRLSNWLFGVARRVILNLRGRWPLEVSIADKTTGTSFWDLVQDDHKLEQSWETEWRQMVLDECIGQARREFDPKVFDAFEQYALAGVAIHEVCQRLNMSRNAVYVAKSKVLSRLRELQRQFE
ncbi:MAG: sigma-70 family RNA polymerase sigma factor [Phycisphaerales bacterium]